MSTIGLNTNTFRVTGKFLEWMNDILVKAKVSHTITDGRKDQLVEFVSRVSDINNTQPQFQLLASIIERELRAENKKPDVFFAALLQELQQNNIDAILPKVSIIVDALEVENTDALSKIN